MWQSLNQPNSQLETSLDSKAYSAGDDVNYASYINRPNEVVRYYDEGPIYDLPATYRIASAHGGHDFKQIEQKMTAMMDLCDELGPWCSDFIFLRSLAELEKKMQRRVSAQLLKDQFGDAETKEDTDRLLQVLSIIQTKSNGVFSAMPSAGDVSPKVMALVDTLKGHEEAGDQFCGIVFVQRRATAHVLGHLLRQWKGLEFLKVGVLVGHAVGKEGVDPDALMKVKQQMEIVRKFGNGELNLLVATQVRCAPSISGVFTEIDTSYRLPRKVSTYSLANW